MRNAVVLSLLFAGTLPAQVAAPTDRLVRIEENTIQLKDSLKKTDTAIEARQNQTRALQDKVIAVDSQNKIIIGIATAAFTIGLAFLIWLYKKLEIYTQQHAETQFTDGDRQLLSKIYTKVVGPNIATATAGGGSPQPPSS